MVQRQRLLRIFTRVFLICVISISLGIMVLLSSSSSLLNYSPSSSSISSSFFYGTGKWSTTNYSINFWTSFFGASYNDSNSTNNHDDHHRDYLSNTTTLTTSLLIDEIEDIITGNRNRSADDDDDCLELSPELWTRGEPELLENVTADVCEPLFRTVFEKGHGAPDEKERRLIFDKTSAWSVPEPHDSDSVLKLVNETAGGGDCRTLRKLIRLPTKPASSEEAQYPLAYVFMGQRNTAQTVRLFRMLYQPQNVYCLAYDAKSSRPYIRTITRLAECFPENVHLNPHPERIYYFGYSILRSVMNCMRVLLRKATAANGIRWNYVQVVSWNDFPLRTNLEMVRIFKILNGSQDSELLNNDTPDYVTYRNGKHGGTRRSVPPNGLTLYKGSFANSMSREFVEFMFSDPTSLRLYEYLNDTKCPEEYYWPTLVHNLQLNAPGPFPGQCEIFYSNAGEKKPFLSRFQVWEWDWKLHRKCGGKWVVLSCVYGVRDLKMLSERPELIAHKLYEEFEPALLYCMERMYWKRVCEQKKEGPAAAAASNRTSSSTYFDWNYYRGLPSVRYHEMSEQEKAGYVCKL